MKIAQRSNAGNAAFKSRRDDRTGRFSGVPTGRIRNGNHTQRRNAGLLSNAHTGQGGGTASQILAALDRNVRAPRRFHQGVTCAHTIR